VEIQAAVVAMIDALHQEQIDYMIVGSFSSNYYGIPRSTEDGDFVIELTGKSLNAVKQRLGDQFEFDPQTSFESVTGTLRTLVRIRSTNFKIELFRLSSFPHDQARFARRKLVPYLGRPIYLPTPEDVIVTKLNWSKSLDRSKDRDDVRDVIAVQDTNLDWSYIHRWTDEHGTTELLNGIRRSIPPL
jgi:hypothetical protein